MALPPFPGTHFDVVALAASKGALDAFSVILAALPAAFPAAVILVRHISPTHQSELANILTKRTPLRVVEADDGAQVCPGTVYIAPPNYHLVIRPTGVLRFADAKGEPLSHHTADVLFTSVAGSFRQRAVVIVLTGGNNDGAEGVSATKRAGGVVIAQDAATSHASGMPRAAAETGDVDFVLTLDEIAPTLLVLTARGGP